MSPNGPTRVSVAALILYMSFASSSSVVAQSSPTADAAPWPPVATFSILGFDPETGEVGAAVQSRVFSVGNGVFWSKLNAATNSGSPVATIFQKPVGTT